MLRLLKNDADFSFIESPDHLSAFAANNDINLADLTIHPDDLVAFQEKSIRETLRRDIENDVADISSILGTTSDGAAIALIKLGELATELSAATSLAEVRAAAQPLADLMAVFLGGIAADTIKLPHMVKGGEAVALTEIGERLTGVAAVYTQNSGE